MAENQKIISNYEKNDKVSETIGHKPNKYSEDLSLHNTFRATVTDISLLYYKKEFPYIISSSNITK